MTTNLTFFDAAYPPATPPNTDGVCIYIGGDTPHVWTQAEIGRQHARFRLPIWVRSNPGQVNVNADAHAALMRLHEIGCPAGSLVALDVETTVAPSWVHAFYSALHAGGYPIIVYGSQSVVLGNDVPDGWYWGADWTDVAHFARGDVMTQYASFRAYDLDLAKSTLPFWDTRPPAQHPVAPPAMPAPVTAHAVDSTTITASWPHVTGAVHYLARVTYQGTLAAPRVITVANTARVTGLHPDHTYTVHVAAGNVAGWSAETNGPTVRTPQ